MSWNRLRQWGADHPDVVDAGIATALLALGVLSVRVTEDVTARMGMDGQGELGALGWAAYVVLVGCLAVRRRFPLVVALVAGVAFPVFQWSGGVEGTVATVALFVAIHAAGAYGRPRARDLVRAVVVLGLMATLVWTVLGAEVPTGGSVLVMRVFSIGLNVFFFAAAWVFGDLSRIRAERERQLAARTAELEVERERNAARAVVDERVRIARELHDVLAHHVSVMGVQAGAARRVLSRSPERATGPLAAIEASARSAVVELQRMLAFLRADDDAGPDGDRSPQPGLGQLHRLAEDVRRAGVAVELVTEGPLDDLPDTVHLSAYRIVQEALTNVLKHAGGGAWAGVHVERGADLLVVEVVDDGRGPGFADQLGTGSGLVGMRERVALHGGTFTSGPRTGGGFRVRAELPLADRPAPRTTTPTAEGLAR